MLSAAYLDYLREQLDEDDEDIPAEEMTPEVQRFFDRLFEQALAIPEKKIKKPKPTKIAPGPDKVVVFRKRYAKGEALFLPSGDIRRDASGERLFLPGDSRWNLHMGERVTERNPLNGNALKLDLFITDADDEG